MEKKPRTGLGEEKKSISFPIVNGMLMDTAEEASKRPMAISSGLRSGFAKATIFRKDEGPWGPLRKMEAKEARESL